jgi:hypothetical protein
MPWLRTLASVELETIRISQTTYPPGDLSIDFTTARDQIDTVKGGQQSDAQTEAIPGK